MVTIITITDRKKLLSESSYLTINNIAFYKSRSKVQKYNFTFYDIIGGLNRNYIKYKIRKYIIPDKMKEEIINSNDMIYVEMLIKIIINDS